MYFKYDSFERENLQYKVGNNFIGGDSLVRPTGGVKFHLKNRIFGHSVLYSGFFKKRFH